METMRVPIPGGGWADALVRANFTRRIDGQVFAFAVTEIGFAVLTEVSTGMRACHIEPDDWRWSKKGSTDYLRTGKAALRRLLKTLPSGRFLAAVEKGKRMLAAREAA